MDNRENCGLEREVAERLVGGVLSATKEQHEDLLSTWRQLNRKSRGALVTAGIFLVFVLAFIRYLADDPTPIEARLFDVATILAVVSISISILAMLTRPVRRAARCPEDVQEDSFAEEHCDENSEATRQRVLSVKSRARSWSAANQRVQSINRVKSALLVLAHLCLTAAVLVATSSLFVRFLE